MDMKTVDEQFLLDYSCYPFFYHHFSSVSGMKPIQTQDPITKWNYISHLKVWLLNSCHYYFFTFVLIYFYNIFKNIYKMQTLKDIIYRKK